MEVDFKIIGDHPGVEYFLVPDLRFYRGWRYRKFYRICRENQFYGDCFRKHPENKIVGFLVRKVISKDTDPDIRQLLHLLVLEVMNLMITIISNNIPSSHFPIV